MIRYFLFLVLLVSHIASAASGKVALIVGDVTVAGQKVQKDSLVNEDQEIIVTGKKSAIQINLNDGSRILFKEGVFRLSPTKEKTENVISVIKGVLFADKAKKMSSLKISTPNAVMGVRGTKFFVEESSSETYLCVCEGTVEIENSKSKLPISKNEDVRVKKDTPFSKSPASDMMIDMSNAGFKEMVSKL